MAQSGKSSRTDRLITITEWKQRNHPFLEKCSIYPGLCDLRRLYVNDTGFFNSAGSPGLQIADICAHIPLRHHRDLGGESAYRLLRRRIVCREGAEIDLIHVDESSLHKDDPRRHVGVFDVEEYKRRADLSRAAKQIER